ncbi:biotin-dependent carboxyltransferase family protein [Parvularcula flava]|uniref:Biotin-dependent carboxyltransferase family protein n=1 Tax=Aquisalinus luteolus TaxID=1566827 RepID=A0A8J3A8Z1_9PROT|nr:biotin-dependent carboxyltransferase family protein [Aquisalinus luteolus]NHK28463.1 biotin-dependent carboxyltransferase family protein [Aquisalinus luteolus]GGH98552.1 carboxylase [Aquisalinus luteolus]
MALRIEKAGLATSLQDVGRSGVAHLGVPPGGAMDCLSLALANWLVGKAPGATAMEITLTGATISFEARMAFALVGGRADITLNDQPVAMQEQHIANPGDVLEIGAMQAGCRIYLATSDDLHADEVFGSASTYAPGGFGGHQGRMLADGDIIATVGREEPDRRTAPVKFHPFLNKGWVLRAVSGPEADLLDDASREALFTEAFRASQRASRQGAELDKPVLSLREAARMQSGPVFPGTVQCPPSGKPYLLMADAQTTGGYPRIAQVIRADRHLMGQIKPGDTVRFMAIEPDEAAQILREKNVLYAELFGQDIF